MTLSRRTLGLGALAAPIALSTSVTASPAATHAQTAPSLFATQVGRFRMTALFDGMVGLPKAYFSHSDMGAMEATFAANGLTGDTLAAPITAYVLQSADQTILIDAGMGGIQMLGDGLGQFGGGLAALNISPGDVDLVVVSHAHPDHIGGLVGPDGAIFPNAEIFVNDVEIGFWTDAGMMAQAPDEGKGLFQIAQQVFAAYGTKVRAVSTGTEVTSGVTMELAPGHTPGHSFVHIDGGDREVLMVADLVHNSVLHTALPDAAFGFDTDSALAAVTRRKALDRAATDQLLIAASHVPFPGFGRFVRDGDAYGYIPASWL